MNALNKHLDKILNKSFYFPKLDGVSDLYMNKLSEALEEFFEVNNNEIFLILNSLEKSIKEKRSEKVKEILDNTKLSVLDKAIFIPGDELENK